MKIHTQRSAGRARYARQIFRGAHTDTNRYEKKPIILYGREFWDKVANFPAPVEFGTISRGDLDLFRRADTVD